MATLFDALRRHPLTAGLTWHDWRVPGHGAIAPIGVLNHHTVSNPPRDFPSKAVVIDGRPDVDGPLCNLLGGRSGAMAGITDGEANHAGGGDPAVLDRIRRGQPPAPRPGPDQRNADGRHWLYGIEWENNGTGEPWAQLETMYLVNAALCDICEWDPYVSVLQHHLWTRRKIDCAFINPPMSFRDFQDEVARVLGGKTPAKEWDDMASKAEVEAAAAAAAKEAVAPVEKKVDEVLRRLETAINGGQWQGGQITGIAGIGSQVAPKAGGGRTIRTLEEMGQNDLAAIRDHLGIPRKG